MSSSTPRQMPFDTEAFALLLRKRMGEANLSFRKLSQLTGISYAKIFRAADNCPTTAETYHRLMLWLKS